jgi:transposase
MSKALSLDLRSRVIRAIDNGLSRRQAAERFGVSASSAVRWHREWRTNGSYAPKRAGGDRLSHRTERHAGAITALMESRPDITLRELKAELAGGGVTISVAALWRFFRRHRITHKKRPVTRPSRTGPTS